MWRKRLFFGIPDEFWPSTQGAGTKPHLKFRFCLQAMFEKKKVDVRMCVLLALIWLKGYQVTIASQPHTKHRAHGSSQVI